MTVPYYVSQVPYTFDSKTSFSNSIYIYLILWLHLALDVGHRGVPAVAALRPHVVVVCIAVVGVDVVVSGVGGDLVIIGGVVSAQPGQEAQGRRRRGSVETSSGHTGLRPREGTL